MGYEREYKTILWIFILKLNISSKRAAELVDTEIHSKIKCVAKYDTFDCDTRCSLRHILLRHIKLRHNMFVATHFFQRMCDTFFYDTSNCDTICLLRHISSSECATHSSTTHQTATRGARYDTSDTFPAHFILVCRSSTSTAS